MPFKSSDYPSRIHPNKYRPFSSLHWGIYDIFSGDGDVRCDVGSRTNDLSSHIVNLSTDRHDISPHLSISAHNNPLCHNGVEII